MAINILNLQPTTISRDLKGKYILIYSQPKVGKTTLACQFPKNLLLAFERGYNNISGAMAVDINKWSDMKLVLLQLESEEAKQMYNTITIDTAQIAWDQCEQYICAQNSVQKIGDIPYGAGYSALSKEFEGTLRKITMMGYGLVLITHVDIRKEIDVNGNEVECYSPALNKRCYPICNRIVDLICYIHSVIKEDGSSERYLYTRSTPRIVAGSRYKYLETKIPFGYNELVNAIGDAIDKSEKLDGATVVDHCTQSVAEKLDFNEIRTKMMELWTTLVGTNENPNEEMARIILKKAEIIFGHSIKLSEITEDQVDLMNLVLLDMQSLAKNK